MIVRFELVRLYFPLIFVTGTLVFTLTYLQVASFRDILMQSCSLTYFSLRKLHL